MLSFLFPAIALIRPLYEQLQVALVEALSLFRVKFDTFAVHFSKLTSMYSFSLFEVMLGLFFAFYGIVAYILVPHYFLVEDYGMGIFLLMLVYFMQIVGAISLISTQVHHFALVMLKPLLCICGRGSATFERLVKNNLAAERNNNTMVSFGIITCIMFCAYIQFIDTIVPATQLQ